MLRALLIGCALSATAASASIAQVTAPPAPFSLVLESTTTGWAARCDSGCHWRQVSFDCGRVCGAIVDANGCSIDQIAPCSGPASGGTWNNHGQYVSTVAQAAEAFVKQRLISEAQAEEIVAQAAQSNCGSKSNARAVNAHRSSRKH